MQRFFFTVFALFLVFPFESFADGVPKQAGGPSPGKTSSHSPDGRASPDLEPSGKQANRPEAGQQEDPAVDACLHGRFPPWLDNGAVARAVEKDNEEEAGLALADSLSRGAELVRGREPASPVQPRRVDRNYRNIIALRQVFVEACDRTIRAMNAAGQEPRAGCVKDTDCKGDRICDAGRCTSPPPPSQRGRP